VINTSLTRINYNNIINLYELLKKFNIKRWRISVPFYEGKWKARSHLYAVSIDEEIYVYKELLKRYINEKPFDIELGYIIRYYVNSSHHKVKRNYGLNDYVCGYYRQYVVILPSGDVTFCPRLLRKEFIVGNILQKTLKELWTSSKMRFFKDLRIKDFLKISKENVDETFLLHYGVGCPANSYLINNNFFSIDKIAFSIFRKIQSDEDMLHLLSSLGGDCF